MPSGREVRPQKWNRIIDLFDNGWYSVIWGSYENRNDRCLGVRWNGDDNEQYGYPKQGIYPLWYVEPDFLSKPILLALQNELSRNPSLARRNEYQRNILIALSECD